MLFKVVPSDALAMPQQPGVVQYCTFLHASFFVVLWLFPLHEWWWYPCAGMSALTNLTLVYFFSIPCLPFTAHVQFKLYVHKDPASFLGPYVAQISVILRTHCDLNALKWGNIVLAS